MVSRFLRVFSRMGGDDDCREVRDLSSDYIDDELDSASRDRVRKHIGRCGPCNAFVNTLRATVNILRSTPINDAPEGFRERVRDAIKSEGAD
jgi:anti-sigma factor RsiW